jgi:hypothetical protein
MNRTQEVRAAQRRTFGHDLETARKIARLTQTNVSDLSQSTAPTLTKNRVGLLERGVARPRPNEIDTLVKLFPSLITVAPRFRPITPVTIPTNDPTAEPAS